MTFKPDWTKPELYLALLAEQGKLPEDLLFSLEDEEVVKLGQLISDYNKWKEEHEQARKAS